MQVAQLEDLLEHHMRERQEQEMCNEANLENKLVEIAKLNGEIEHSESVLSQVKVKMETKISSLHEKILYLELKLKEEHIVTSELKIALQQMNELKSITIASDSEGIDEYVQVMLTGVKTVDIGVQINMEDVKLPVIASSSVNMVEIASKNHKMDVMEEKVGNDVHKEIKSTSEVLRITLADDSLVRTIPDPLTYDRSTSTDFDILLMDVRTLANNDEKEKDTQHIKEKDALLHELQNEILTLSLQLQNANDKIQELYMPSISIIAQSEEYQSLHKRYRDLETVCESLRILSSTTKKIQVYQEANVQRSADISSLQYSILQHSFTRSSPSDGCTTDGSNSSISKNLSGTSDELLLFPNSSCISGVPSPLMSVEQAQMANTEYNTVSKSLEGEFISVITVPILKDMSTQIEIDVGIDISVEANFIDPRIKYAKRVISINRIQQLVIMSLRLLLREYKVNFSSIATEVDFEHTQKQEFQTEVFSEMVVEREQDCHEGLSCVDVSNISKIQREQKHTVKNIYRH